MLVGQLVEHASQRLELGSLLAAEVIEQQPQGGVRDLHLLRVQCDRKDAALVRCALETGEDLSGKLADTWLVRLI
ncbi:MAG TPA: hypothetical protein VGH21_07125 [Solirubrobacteraceae bacterium]